MYKFSIVQKIDMCQRTWRRYKNCFYFFTFNS